MLRVKGRRRFAWTARLIDIEATVFMEEHAMQRSISRRRAKLRPRWTPPAVMVAMLFFGQLADAQPSADDVAHGASSAPSIFATAFDDPGGLPETAIDPATLSGVRPGETTAAQLTAKWGEGKAVSQTEDGTVLRFAVESFKNVEVTLVEDTVRTVTIHLTQPLPLASVRTKL